MSVIRTFSASGIRVVGAAGARATRREIELRNQHPAEIDRQTGFLRPRSLRGGR